MRGTRRLAILASCLCALVPHASLEETADASCFFLQINDHSDGVAKLATDYSAVEIAFFRAVVRRSLSLHRAQVCTVLKHLVLTSPTRSKRS